MADSTNANAGGNGQVPPADPGNGQVPTQGAPAQQSGSPSAGSQNGPVPTGSHDGYKPPSADEWQTARRELDEARREAAKYRDEVRKRDDANLSEQQKRERDYTDLQTWKIEHEGDTLRLRLELAGIKLAPSLGINDPAAAMALIQAEHAGELKVNANTGEPENLSDLLKAVIKEHPALAARSAPQQPQPQGAAAVGGAGNPGRQAGNGALTREAIEAMPIRERVVRMAEIDAWRKANPDEAARWAAGIR
jgi:hypothetical protein